MTAEIAILNKSAVALAADSASTLSIGENQKIYNTANKLFNLNKYHPIGIMVYNKSEFMDVPLETIIKAYRTNVKDEICETIAEEANKFIKFIESNEDLFPKNFQDDFVKERIKYIFIEDKNTIEKKITEETKTKALNEDDIKIIVAEIINKFFENLNKIKYLPQFNDEDVKDFILKYSDLFNQYRVEILEKIPLKDDQFDKIKKCCAFVLYKDYIYEAKKTGIVITGFGSKEYFPSLYSFEVECLINGRLKYKEIENEKEIKGSLISPFAQSYDMAAAFIDGIMPELLQALYSNLTILNKKNTGELDKLPELNNINKDLKDDIIKKMKSLYDKSFEKFFEDVRTIIGDNFSQPIVKSVTNLPKEDLAVLAESIVNLTYLRKRFTMEAETVGGAIDVAVISKGDGFIWIKRKHYFQPELNPHFFKHYFK